MPPPVCSSAGRLVHPSTPPSSRSRLGVTIDILRNWDRNGLIDVPRDPSNGYRRYGAREISRLRVIRMLSRAGYSLSAILRMLIQLDRGEKTDLRRALDTPRPDEDVYLASDRWISTVVRNLHIYGQATNDVRFLFRRGEFH